jgi:chemotaxis protein CheX
MNTAILKPPRQLILDESLAQVAVKSVQKAMKTLFGVDAHAGATLIQNDFISKGDISGILGMVQQSLEATMIISFQKPVIFFLLSKLYNRNFTDIDKSVRDGVGELTNIIYASVKKELNESGHEFKLAIPNVIIGAEHSIINIHDGKTMVIPFRVETGSFFLEIAMQS